MTARTGRHAARPEIRELVLPGRLPCLAFGAGPPLLSLMGLTATHDVPRGMARRAEVDRLAPLGDRYTVHIVNRPPGLPAGTSMADLASAVAAAIDSLGGRVSLIGTSTGGSLALQVAVDHGGHVDRLAVVAAACRLGPAGRDTQRRVAALAAEGHWRRAWATLGRRATTSRLSSWPSAAMLGLVGGTMRTDDPQDMLRTLAAEDRFDLCDRLGGIEASTLIVGGARDGLYTPELFRATARSIPNARLHLMARAGHLASVMSREARWLVTGFLLG